MFPSYNRQCHWQFNNYSFSYNIIDQCCYLQLCHLSLYFLFHWRKYKNHRSVLENSLCDVIISQQFSFAPLDFLFSSSCQIRLYLVVYFYINLDRLMTCSSDISVCIFLSHNILKTDLIKRRDILPAISVACRI